MKPVAAAQVQVRIGRVVVEPGALGAGTRAEFGQRLQSAIAAELAGGAAGPQAAADPVTRLAAIIAAQLPAAANTSSGRGRHGRR
ncbi:MAG TPA: hypothetical protein VGV07_22190 [Devosia sp.]|jgi:hypothetical protein|uniref:hypothetical protein n=1 Tax=Devosia sp. TaxID=1871048 RepID=UPI002DDD35A0|nr:hypothetical protein [Devosia sp.]HEV2517978.1 hypothetical protein [Devosia sp.]